MSIKSSSLSAATKIEELTAGSDEKHSSIFVGAEREENLIRNDPDKSEFTMCLEIPPGQNPLCGVAYSCSNVHLPTAKSMQPVNTYSHTVSYIL